MNIFQLFQQQQQNFAKKIFCQKIILLKKCFNQKWTKFFLTKKSLRQKNFLNQKCFLTKIFLSSKMFFDQQFFQLKFWFGLGKLGFGLFLFFLNQHILDQIFWEQKLFGNKILLGPTVFGTKILGINFIWGLNYIFLLSP